MSWKLILPILGFMIDVIAASEKRVTRVEEPILASPAPTALRRQAYSNICGYENANVLSQFTCNEGSACFAEPSYNVAGYCCRIGNFASCTGPTQCIAEASLSASCNGDCSSNERITKCSDLQSPYCFTRYYIQGGLVTPSELGCTNTQGELAYLYTTYTGAGSVDFDVTTPTAALTTPPPTAISDASTSAGGSESGASSSGVSDSAGGSEDTTSASATSTSASGGGGDSNSGNTSNGGSNNGGSDSSGGGSSVPAGPIAGGVVGGVVVLAAAAVAVTWLILRHRRRPKPEKTNLINHGQVSEYSGSNGGQAGLAESKPSHPLLSPPYVNNAPQEIGINDRIHELYEQRELRPQLP